MDEQVAEQIAVFSRLTELERSGAPLSAYASILDDGKTHLALLAKLADYAVTHKMEDHIDGLVSRKVSPLFRLYTSETNAQEMMRMDAMAGENLYGPVAELFGFPSIAGDIFEHAYRINHPEIYMRMAELSSDETIMQRMASTQGVVIELSRILRNALSSYGFEAEIELRKQKHLGKAMKKALRIMECEWEDGGKRGTLDDYVKSRIASFDYDDFHDCVALRVIVHKIGESYMDNLQGMMAHPGSAHENKTFTVNNVNRLLSSIWVGPLHLALKIVLDTIMSLRLIHPLMKQCLPKITYYDKPNGYRAFHFDTVSDSENDFRVLPFEVQLKTSEWHNVAEHGKAAHYYYLGGDTSFVDLIRRAYHDIIHRDAK